MRTFLQIRVLRGLVLATVLTAHFAGVADLAAQYEEPESRMFRIQHRLVQEFEPMVRSLLSKRGTMNTSPELRMILVNDLPANLAAIDSLITAYDQPKRQVQITIQLIMGTQAEDPQPLPEDMGFLGTLIEEQNYHFNAYDVLDQGVLLADDGSATSLALAGNRYAVAFALTTSLEPDRTIKFRNFRLIENQRSLRGTEQRELVATEFGLKDGAVELLTAARQDDEGKTLLVFITGVLL
jgi:hypothetical protein